MFCLFKALRKTLLAAGIAGLVLSCTSNLGLKKKPVLPTPPSTAVESLENQDNALILHIQKTLPEIPLGLSKDEVEEKLGLPSHFRGLILSQGTGTDFRYFYELGEYELVLAFDYQKKPKGMYLQGFLRRV